MTNRKFSFLFVLLVTGVLAADSTIVKLFGFGFEEPSEVWNMIMFLISFLVFAGSSVLLLESIRQTKLKQGQGLAINLRHLQGIMLSIQYLNIAILLVIILQMVFVDSYSIHLLIPVVYLSHVSSIAFIGLLVYLLLGWLKSNRNHIIATYTFSFTLLSFSIAFSLLYVTLQLQHSQFSIIRPYPITLYIATFPASDLSVTFGPVLDITYLLSFVFSWIATAALLVQYTRKIGKIKYWILMSIPLLYYLFPFELYFASTSLIASLDSPIIMGVIYVLFFSATKQVGGILFAMTFLTSSTILNISRVRLPIALTGIGIAILFSSMDISSLLYTVYPPFGLVTVSFMPLGAFLLLNGIFVTARYISQDSELRKKFYQSAASQIGLLKTIGVSEMEKELEKRARSIISHSSVLEEETKEHYPEENIKEWVHQVIKELNKRGSDKPT